MNRGVFLLLISILGAHAFADENLIFNSVEDSRQYYQKLVHAVRSGETIHLENFNHLFAPADPAPPLPEEGFTKCMGHKVTDHGCSPDTFYSWGGAEKLQNI